MDSIVDINHFFPVGVISGFVGEMKVFTDEFLPSGLNPLLFQTSLRVYPMIGAQTFYGII